MDQVTQAKAAWLTEGKGTFDRAEGVAKRLAPVLAQQGSIAKTQAES
jgi:hypothetical protein